MDPIKEAFSKIKEDILSLKEEVSSIRTQLLQLNLPISSNQTTPTHNPTYPLSPTNQQTNTSITSTSIPPSESLIPLKELSSIGNRGVPTNKPTNQQTNRQDEIPYNSSHNPSNDPISEFKKATKILSSLDGVKKEIYYKFKGLTPQEMLVFSTLYALEEENTRQFTYKLIAEILHLSESSIRDYINKITKKGVPIDKIRQNNKTILLKISPDLKNIASLITIQRLRDL